MTFSALSIAKENTNKLNEDLYWASFKGDDKMVAELLNKGANAKFEFYEKNTPLHNAVIAQDGSLESAKKPLMRPIPLPESGLAERKLNIVKLLVKNGANVNKANFNGITPLHLAETVEIADFLIKNGADVHAIARTGDTSRPLSYCAWHHISVCKVLLNAGASEDIWASEVGETSPLIMAVRANNFEFAKLLIEARTYINYQTESGDSALEEALVTNLNRNQNIAYERSEIIKLLVNNGAVLNESSRTGSNELVLAARSADYELAEFFIRKRGNVNAFNREKRTALFEVVTHYRLNPKKYMPIIKLLVKHGADMNVGTKNWYSSPPILHVQDLELLKYMINNGADWNFKDENGKGVEHYLRGSPELLSYINSIK